MPSLLKTAFLQLNKWAGNEYPKREDFVSDNEKIDAFADDISSQMAQIEQDVQDVSALADGKATTQTLSATITTTWTGTEAPYTQTIAVTGIQVSDNPIVDIDLSSISVYADQQAISTDWSKIFRITTQANQITVYATDKSTVAIPIQLKVVR